MKLKSLEIIGFKSFMDKTVITFDKDITAIVGPNGCGKSNVVDAIRWVMGEQSAKHLRGKEMQDVIFVGSEKHPPLSMASVELTFSTEGYQTPADYLNHPEISICRRLYRTGESEYFINKVPVRLKDITDLFLGTGIGTKAYSIIEQDQVSRIVTVRPEERRFFIEEVAGISRFKSRKEGALRKMEATNQNLLRLTDLIVEIERQVRSLERQAKKAEKYKKFKVEFEKYDLALTSNEYAEALEHQNKWEKELRQFDTEDAGLKARLKEAENLLEITRLTMMEREGEIQQLQNDLFEATNYVQLSEATLRHKKEEREGLSKRTGDIEKDLSELQKELTGVTNGLFQISSQKMMADLEEETLKEEVCVLQLQVEEEQKKGAELQESLDKRRGEIHSAESRCAQIETLCHAEAEKEKELKKRVENDQADLDQLQKQFKQIQKIYNDANDSLADLKQQKLELIAKTDNLAGELNSHQKNLSREETGLNRAKEELTLRKSRLSSLEELQKNFEGYQEGTRSVMLKKAETGEEGIFGTVADFVETEPKYENAVSAVLGEKLQYVVVKSQEEGLEAMEYLSTAVKGRASFVPTTIRSYGSEGGGQTVPLQQGVLGPLGNFVKMKESLGSIEDFLFGDVVLVEDLKKALDVWSSNGYRKTLVTLRGEVIDPAGIITGGSSENTSKALLEKKREIKELIELTGRLECELEEKEKTRKILADRVKNLQNSLETIKSSAVEEEIKVANQEKDVIHFRKEMDSMGRKKEEILNRIITEKRGIDEIKPKLDSLAEEEKGLKIKAQNLQELVSRTKNEFELSKTMFNESSGKLTKKKIELAQARERNVHFEREIERLMSEKYQLRLDLAEKEKQNETTRQRDLFLEKESAHITRMLDKKLKAKTTLDEKFKEQKGICESLSAEIREKEVNIKEMRKSLDETGTRLNSVTVSLTEVRGQMKHLAGQCLERHMKNLPEIYNEYRDENLNREEAMEQVSYLKDQLNKLGGVSTDALDEYEELKERFEHLSKQKDDLEASLKSLERVIQRINRTTKEKFLETFNHVNIKFQSLFPKLFQGGKAKLVLTDENNLLETGVEVIAQPPGKKLQSISLLSGGEKALTAVSLIFSIFQIKPAPFCLLDEVDAPLDDANVTRYNDMIRGMTHRTQFIVITHNKRTMEMTDVLYGITMQDAGVSQLISVELN